MRVAFPALLALLILASFACQGGGTGYDDAGTGIVIVTVEAERSVDAPPFLQFAPLVNTGTVTSGPVSIGPTATPTPRASVTPATSPTAIAATATPSQRQDITPGGPLASPMPASTPSTASVSCSVPANPSVPKVDLKTVEGRNGITLQQRVETRTYAVGGCTADEIATSLRRSTTQSSAGRYEVGVTSSTTRYSYRYEEQGGQCRLKAAQISAEITVLLPELPNTQGISQGVMSRWDSFMAALRGHEQGHVDIILKSAGVIRSTFENATQAMPCHQLETTLKAAVQRETDVANAANEAYDATTNHGVNQGVAFP